VKAKKASPVHSTCWSGPKAGK